MRILILAPIFSPKGPIPKHTPWLVEGLKALGCEVELASWGAKRDEPSLLKKMVDRAVDIVDVRRKLKNHRYEVVIVKTAHDWNSLARDLPLVLTITNYCPCLILQFHGSWTKTSTTGWNTIYKWLTKLMIENVHGGLVLSNEEISLWRALTSKIPFYKVKNPYKIQDDGINEVLHKREDIRPLKILFSGRIIKEKGIFELLSAFAAVSTLHDCVLHLAGDGKDMNAVRRQINRLEIDKKVLLSGWLQGNALKKAYQEAHIFVLPSWSEGFPFVLYEAMEAGLPIITTEMRGMADELVAGVHATFIPPRNEEALAEAMHALLSDPQLRQMMGRNNLQKIREYDPQAVANDYLANVKKICLRDYTRK